MRNLVLAAVAGALLAFGTVAFAQFEAHPHLRAAHDHIVAAIRELRAANDGHTEFGGHRDRAEQLCVQAEAEIRQSAEYANAHHH